MLAAALALLLAVPDTPMKILRHIERERPGIIVARAAIRHACARFLEQLGRKVAAAKRDGAIKIAKGLDDDDAVRAAGEGDWSSLGAEVKPHLSDIAQDGAKEAVLQVEADLSAALEQVNEESVRWAQARSAELVTRISETTRERVREVVVAGVEAGQSNDEIAALLADDVVFSDDRALTIARTETAFADVAGNILGWKASGVVAGKEWKTSGEDPCPECEAMEGEVVALDEEFEDGDPPLHPRCVLAGTLVSAAGVSAHFKRWFRGEVVCLIVESGHDLTVTPNHPVLTARGWVVAGHLREGDYLVETADPAAAVCAVDPDDHYVQTRVEEIADALRVAGKVSTRRVPVAPEDFHGDGVADEDVDVVRTERALGHRRDAPAPQERDCALFLGPNVREQPLLRGGDLLAVGAGLPPSTNRLMRGRSSGSTLRSGVPGRLDPVGVALGANAETGTTKDGADDRAVAADAPRDVDAGFPRGIPSVERRDLRIGEPAHLLARLLRGTRGVPGLTEPAHDDLGRDPETSADGIDRLAPHVRLVKLLDVRRLDFSGHVYNLQTATGWYFAAGLIVHNCECVLLPVLSDTPEDEGE